MRSEAQPEIPQEEILKFLKKRQGILEGVCITGGEPTLHADLPDFIRKIKEMGYFVKLDTNGTNPAMTESLVKNNLVDKIAMDIKTSRKHYPVLCGIDLPNMAAIEKSIAFLLKNTVDYEFRTTVVKELHREQDFIEIGQWINGAKAYYLQAYKDSEEVIKPGFSSFSFQELSDFKNLLEKYVSVVEIRGID